MPTTQEWTREQIRTLLESNPRMVERSLVKLYERQTADEQASLSTKHENGQGFNAFDAEFLSSLATQVIGGRTLSHKQLAAARKALKKYVGQLTAIANGEG